MEANEIRNILTNSPLEVLATNESKLDSTIVDNEVYVPDYSIIRKDCNRSAGGVALYTLFFSYKNIVFPGQAEYSYFSADFRLQIFLYYS